MPVLYAAAVVALGAAGVVFAAKLLVKEWQRVNTELDRARAAPVENTERAGVPTLQRDPATGEYRPRR
jgi:hypothetical protein